MNLFFFAVKKIKEKFKDHFEVGVYQCSQCKEPLFPSMAKFEHGREKKKKKN